LRCVCVCVLRVTSRLPLYAFRHVRATGAVWRTTRDKPTSPARKYHSTMQCLARLPQMAALMWITTNLYLSTSVLPVT